VFDDALLRPAKRRVAKNRLKNGGDGQLVYYLINSCMRFIYLG